MFNDYVDSLCFPTLTNLKVKCPLNFKCYCLRIKSVSTCVGDPETVFYH